MPNLDSLIPIADFAKAFSSKVGIKPRSVIVMIDRHQDELVRMGAVFKTQGKSRLIDQSAFLKWYLCH